MLFCLRLRSEASCIHPDTHSRAMNYGISTPDKKQVTRKSGVEFSYADSLFMKLVLKNVRKQVITSYALNG